MPHRTPALIVPFVFFLVLLLFIASDLITGLLS